MSSASVVHDSTRAFGLTRDEDRPADLLTFGVPEGWAQVWAVRTRDGEVAVIVAPGPVPAGP
ncbi:hypothetical protein [Kitasatospora sp. NPDC087314]|uniref:hypothetical protein n=1 Tax=Kitasatospora sp. NPDC087314 TaxID=3364068 RepID=UPI00380762F0